MAYWLAYIGCCYVILLLPGGVNEKERENEPTLATMSESMGHDPKIGNAHTYYLKRCRHPYRHYHAIVLHYPLLQLPPSRVHFFVQTYTGNLDILSPPLVA